MTSYLNPPGEPRRDVKEQRTPAEVVFTLRRAVVAEKTMMEELAEQTLRTAIMRIATGMVGEVGHFSNDREREKIRELWYRTIEDVLHEPEMMDLLRSKIQEAIAFIQLLPSRRL